MHFNFKHFFGVSTLIFFFIGSLFANSNLTYSRVLLKTDNGQALFKTLAENDLYIDHAARSKIGFVVVFNNKEIQQLKNIGVTFEILIEDLEKHEAKRIAEEMQKPEIKQRLSSKRIGFDYGSHAGYNTPAELYAKLDEISNTYPNIAATKVSIGTTYEGRDIYMLKISDNPNADESANEPAVYYDAMHHAREPLSMMSTLYYMFWLVENYGIDPVATHIINNRELFFVPIVNVDGYEYNILTNPNGGGFWRKNRRPDLLGGTGCFGTDPNRNYGADWGGPGASTNPCSDTYRGTGPFSELCTQAVRDLVNSINPVMAFSCHSYSEIYIESDWDAVNVEKFYADYSLDMCAEYEFGYEQGESLLYAVSGGTTEFLNSTGAISWTPEIGSVFWEPISQIIPYAEKHLPGFIYIAQVAGDYPDVKQAIINNGNDVLAGQTYNIDVELLNKGRTQTANNISVAISSISSNASIVTANTTAPNLAARQTVWTASPLQISVSNSANAGDIIEVEITVTSNGIEYEKEIQKWVVGNQTILLTEDGSNGLGAFTSINNGFLDWDTTYVMRRSGTESISDSPLQAADNNTLNYLMTSNSISLANTTKPVLEFWIALGLSNFNTYSNSDPNDDNCRLEINVNNGGWQAISADDTQNINGGPRFVLNNPWAKQIVDLSAYIGTNIEVRFTLDASDFSEPDGVFIDDLRIVDYKDTAMPTALIDGNSTLTICEGEAVTVNHSSNNFDSFIWNSGDGATSTLNPATFTYSTQGVYTLTLQVANANGSDTDNITVVVDVATPITFSSLPSSVSSNQPISLTATPAGGVFSGNGVILNGFNPALVDPGIQTITYTYTNNSGCISTANTNIFVFDITYLFVNYNLGTISPKLTGNSELVIDSKARTNYEVSIYDVSGRALYAHQTTVEAGVQPTGMFPFKNLNKGLYIFMISNGEEVRSEKVYLAQ